MEKQQLPESWKDWESYKKIALSIEVSGLSQDKKANRIGHMFRMSLKLSKQIGVDLNEIWIKTIFVPKYIVLPTNVVSKVFLWLSIPGNYDKNKGYPTMHYFETARNAIGHKGVETLIYCEGYIPNTKVNKIALSTYYKNLYKTKKLVCKLENAQVKSCNKFYTLYTEKAKNNELYNIKMGKWIKKDDITDGVCIDPGKKLSEWREQNE